MVTLTKEEERIASYEAYWNDPKFNRDWEKACRYSDCCSSWILKYIARVVLWFAGSKRTYKVCCKDHDFDYRYGWKYGMTFKLANKLLGICAEGGGHPIIGKILFYGTNKFGKRSFRGFWTCAKRKMVDDEEYRLFLNKKNNGGSKNG